MRVAQAVGSVARMFVIGIIVAVAGVVIFLGGLLRTTRVNPADRVPYFGEAKTSPKGTYAMRAGGGALIVVSTALLSRESLWWVVGVLVVWLGATVALIAVHNARVEA